MDTRDSIKQAMQTLSAMNGGRRVVLHLNATMLHPTPVTAEGYLPVMNIEGDDGFYRLPQPIRDQAADYFGAVAKEARKRVDEINEEFGVTPDEAREIVLAVMARGRHE